MTYERFTQRVMERDERVTKKYLKKFTFRLLLSFLFLTFDVMYLSVCVLPKTAVPIIGVCFLFLFIFLYDYMAEDEGAFKVGKRLSRFWYIIVTFSIGALLCIRLFVGG